jgi:hypothetical protein
VTSESSDPIACCTAMQSDCDNAFGATLPALTGLNSAHLLGCGVLLLLQICIAGFTGSRRPL